jgi:2-amino-4-hydroxy-6-hydroxymethyldihydropteridine diphosphokinase
MDRHLNHNDFSHYGLGCLSHIMATKKTIRAVLALGSNMGDRLQFMQRGLDLLREHVEIRAISGVYESEPEGDNLEGDFLNAAIAIDTELSAEELLEVCQKAEEDCGRQRFFQESSKSRNRTLDCDIIFYGKGNVEETGLRIPHPRWRERCFVVMPLLDILDELVDGQRREVEGVAGEVSGMSSPCRITENVLH